ncbi:MAG: cation:proton antiporter subunit C [Desulfobulbus sp.]|jgi:multicomponent Na+:H+ antiporter subunit C|nr:cation:proton antiporter subunit C [Desulfobulbus sp.]
MDTVIGLYNYWIVVVLMMLGFYIVIANENLVKKLMGLSIFQTSVFILYISMGKIKGATAPILDERYSVYSNPLPHVLILTAIVVGISTTALALALVIRIREAYGSIEEGEIQDQDISDLLECQLEAYGPDSIHLLHRQDTVE